MHRLVEAVGRRYNMLMLVVNNMNFLMNRIGFFFYPLDILLDPLRPGQIICWDQPNQRAHMADPSMVVYIEAT